MKRTLTQAIIGLALLGSAAVATAPAAGAHPLGRYTQTQRSQGHIGTIRVVRPAPQPFSCNPLLHRGC
jgi:hypothetical protein